MIYRQGSIYSIHFNTVNKMKVCCVYATLSWHIRNTHPHNIHIDTVNR